MYLGAVLKQAVELTGPAIWLYWSLATGAAIFALLPLRGASGFRHAVLLSACRGKLWEGRPAAKLGPLTAISVPQSWFGHFYLIGVCVNLGLIVLQLVTAKRGLCLEAATFVGSLLLSIHLGRRLAETEGLMRYPPGSRMHLVAYLFGLSYYIVLPCTVALANLRRCYVWHQERQLWSPARFDRGCAGPGTMSLLQYVGIAVFLASNVLQLWSHSLLASLAASSGNPKRGTDVYQVPTGGPFELVSCPHYLAEILIYLGLALLCGQPEPLTYMALLWVHSELVVQVSNLSLAAGPTHAWYKKKFEDYPKYRRALIPYIY